MACVQNNLIVIPGGMLKSHSVKVSARQHRQLERFCSRSGWTMKETVDYMVRNFMDEAPIWERQAERDGQHA